MCKDGGDVTFLTVFPVSSNKKSQHIEGVGGQAGRLLHGNGTRQVRVRPGQACVWRFGALPSTLGASFCFFFCFVLHSMAAAFTRYLAFFFQCKFI